jgi:hypothetical protein
MKNKLKIISQSRQNIKPDNGQTDFPRFEKQATINLQIKK